MTYLLTSIYTVAALYMTLTPEQVTLEGCYGFGFKTSLSRKWC